MRRSIGIAAALAALFAVVVGTVTNASAQVRARAASSCSATLAIEAPITGPVSFLGGLQLEFAQEAINNYNKTYGTHVTLAQDDTQLVASQAVTKAQSIIASNAVGVIGPAGSQEVEAVGPLFGRQGIPLISPSATKISLAGPADPTFFRVVPNDNIQGPQDANFIVNKLHPKAVMLIDDGEAYSQGLATVMTPILKKAHIAVTHLSFQGTDTGATLAAVLKTFATKLTSAQKVVVIPWQNATEAEQLGLDIKAAHKKATLFGTDGDWQPGKGGFEIDGSYVSSFAPNIADINKPLDKSVVKGVGSYGAFGPFGTPAYVAAQVFMNAIHNVCKAGQQPSRANVLAQVRKTDIAPSANILNIPIKFTSTGNLAGNYGYLYHINNKGTYVQINAKTGATL